MSDQSTATSALIVSLEELKDVHKRGIQWHPLTCAFAARGGHLDIIEWLREHGGDWKTHTCSNAAFGGHLDILKWARKEGCPWDSKTCALAAKGGNLEILQWARTNGCEWDVTTCIAAIESQSIEILEWALNNGCPTETIRSRGVKDLCGAAAVSEDEDIIALVFESHGCVPSADSYCYAARHGNVRSLEQLQARECEWNTDTCLATVYGHQKLDNLKWLHEQSCPWDTSLCTVATCLGKLEMLEYAVDNGCPVDLSQIRKFAEEKHHQHIVDWVSNRSL